MTQTLPLLSALLLAPIIALTCAGAPQGVFEPQATTPPGASEPFGVSVTRDGGLSLDGKPLRALGVNYFNAFIRTLKNGDDTSYDAGFEVALDGNAAVACVNDDICLSTRIYDRRADTFGIWSDTAGSEFAKMTTSKGEQ